MSYTPGPWTLGHGRTLYGLRGAGGKYISWRGDGPAKARGNITAQELIANARLIAAAPDMHKWMARLRECSIQGLAKIPDELYDELAEILTAIEEGGSDALSW